jgi:uncharacterized integral membrane protein
MKYLTMLVSAPLTVFVVLFAVSNSADVSVALLPGDEGHAVPVHTLGLGMLALGFLCGAVFVSILAQRLRFRYWQEKKKSERLEKELDLLYRDRDRVTDGVVSLPPARTGT